MQLLRLVVYLAAVLMPKPHVVAAGVAVADVAAPDVLHLVASLSQQNQRLMSTARKLRADFDALAREHEALERRAAERRARTRQRLESPLEHAAPQRRALTSASASAWAATCADPAASSSSSSSSDPALVVDEVGFVTDDVRVGTSSVADAMDAMQDAATAMQAIHSWACLRGNLLRPFQTFETQGGNAWDHFVMDGEDYLALAQFDNIDGSQLELLVFRYDNATQQFEEFQVINTTRDSGVEYFEMDGGRYLAVPSGDTGLPSFVYRFNGTSRAFEVFQELGAGGMSVGLSHFAMNVSGNEEGNEEEGGGGADVDAEDHFLALATYFNASVYDATSIVYRFDRALGRFVPFQAFQTHGAFDWAPFQMELEPEGAGDIDGGGGGSQDQFLVLANMRNTTSFDQVSLLYRFDNVTGLFVEFQAFALSGAFDWEPFVMGGAQFLAVAVHRNITTTRQQSVVYRYNATAGAFQPFQKIDTLGAKAWRHFELGGAHFLAVANNFDTLNGFAVESVIYRYDDAAGRFLDFVRVPGVGAFFWEHFTLLDGRAFLAVACMQNTTSYLQTSTVYQLNTFCFG